MAVEPKRELRLAMGDKEQAFAWLTKAVAERNRLDPVLDPLRGYPRFEKIVASLAPK